MKRVYLVGGVDRDGAGLSSAGHLNAQSGKKQATLVSKPTAANPADFVGSETCATCHAEVAKKFDDQSAHQDGADARRHGRDLRELPRAGQGARGGRRRRDQDLQSRQARRPKMWTPSAWAATRGRIPTSTRSPHAKAGVGCIELPQRPQREHGRSRC